MVEMVNGSSTIKAATHKMRRIDRAMNEWSSEMAGRAQAFDTEYCSNCGAPTARPTLRVRAPRFDLPLREEWEAILTDPTISDEIFDQWASLQYHWLAVLSIDPRRPKGLTTIPFEEQVVLLTVRQLASLVRSRQSSDAPAV
jgi:hypothetical protein